MINIRIILSYYLTQQIFTFRQFKIEMIIFSLPHFEKFIYLIL